MGSGTGYHDWKNNNFQENIYKYNTYQKNEREVWTHIIAEKYLQRHLNYTSW